MPAASNRYPTNKFDDQYTSLIQPIKIFLPPRRLDDDKSRYDDFVGRGQLMERLFLWLSDRNQRSGSYLVTGFRGMGKTSLVNRVTERLYREIKPTKELLSCISLMIFIIGCGLVITGILMSRGDISQIGILTSVLSTLILIGIGISNSIQLDIWRRRLRFPNRKLFNKHFVNRMARGTRQDMSQKEFRNIKVSINLGHEVLRERDILGLITTNVRDKYKAYIKSIQPRWGMLLITSMLVAATCGLLMYTFKASYTPVTQQGKPYHDRAKETATLSFRDFTEQPTASSTAIATDNWFSRTLYNVVAWAEKAYYAEGTCLYVPIMCWMLLFILFFVILRWLGMKGVSLLPRVGTSARAVKRLDTLVDRIVATTDEEIGGNTTVDKSLFSFSLFSRRRHKIMPIADIREIETELASIINDIADGCTRNNQARFIIVFDEMDKIDPAMVEPHKSSDMPEFTDSVKGFPDGMDSRERRRSVLRLLANIKLFVSSAHAKFVFISGRELYDAYQADLSDRDFAISSIFTGVLNVDSFLTPEGGQTDVRSMSEWYIANRLLPQEWLSARERRNAQEREILKPEMPSLRWYYEYLIESITNDETLNDNEKLDRCKDANYVMGFLLTFAAYLTHISNGSPKKIFLYFEKNIRRAIDTMPINDWGDVCIAGVDQSKKYKDQKVLFFGNIQQKTINFVYYLAGPIMGTITNDLSNFGDRFLVSLSFIIDHIYKHHNRSFSWRNLEQIPDLLKTSKAPELRDSVMSIMEYLTQVHITNITIGLNEYKFHRSIAEEISMMSKMSDEASAIFNFTLDESLSVIQLNTRMLDYYIELDKKQSGQSSKRQYLPIIARIHSNIGDLHYWDEDYYAAALSYRAAIASLPDDKSTANFLTKLRCMLKLGLACESRKLYPNAYQIFTQIISLLIRKRWIDEDELGLTLMETRTKGWRGKQHTLFLKDERDEADFSPSIYTRQFKHLLFEGDYNTKAIATDYGFNFDEAVSTLSRDLTQEKSDIVGRLTLFEEVRYVYQAILAKLSIIEKMDMSGITQTNIDVAEGEFRTIHKSVNIREKFVISADFFRKLAEILYYKNSLTILTKNQDAFYATVYYEDCDLLSNLDDFCINHLPDGKSALTVKHDVKFFFNRLNSVSSNNTRWPRVEYTMMESYEDNLQRLFMVLRDNLDTFFSDFADEEVGEKDKARIQENVRHFLQYNIEVVRTNESEYLHINNLGYCDYHRQEFRKRNLRPPCYACKYYTRSLRILTDNMFEDEGVLLNRLTKSLGVLKNSFKTKLLYTGSVQIRTMAQTLEGFGDVMFSCSSGNVLEGKKYKTPHGLSPAVIKMLQELCAQKTEADELKTIELFELHNSNLKLSRFDKSVLYYWDAHRFYLIDSCYSGAIGCLNKIINIIVYYIEVLCYHNDGAKMEWPDEADTVSLLIGDSQFNHSFLATLFGLVSRYTGYQYDQINLTEINELKWIYSLEIRDNIDLSKLSLYPKLRSAWLRIVETRAKGLRYLAKRERPGYEQTDYTKFVALVYPIIAPKRRYETTSYEEVLGYYTKLRFNDHVLNNILRGNPLLGTDGYAWDYHIVFFEKLANYLESDVDTERLDYSLFKIEDGDASRRFELLEFLIHDTLVCITNMIKVFAPHVHISSYSKSFIGIVYNYYWEWVRKYEFLYSLYQYHDLLEKGNDATAQKIIDNFAGGIYKGDNVENRERLSDATNRCRSFLRGESASPYGSRADRFYEHLRHDIDDITINTIYSNYAAEMALKYYKMSEEMHTEGQSYKAMIGTLYYLNDDFNNDTCQFNTACDRYLLNCGVVEEQRRHLEEIYKNSNIYKIQKAYVKNPVRIQKNAMITDDQFERSQFINSEY